MKRRTSSQNSGVGGSPSDCDIMASGSLDVTCASETSEAAEECSGKKKSKFQTFKNFFVKKKRKDSPTPLGESVLKGSQSIDDIISTESPVVQTLKVTELGSNMGNKAMSHDSVFVSDSHSSENNEALGASQDNIHGKVKSLQQQLKQGIRLGSPPALIYGRKAEDTGAFSDDDGLPCSPPEYSSLHTVLASTPHTTQRGSCLSMETSDSDDDQMSYDSSSRPSTPQGPVPADFSLPANSDCCLDSTAARHRIAVKAKACTRRKPVSRHMLETKRRDLREKLLLRETEDKLRIVTIIVEEESEYLPMVPDSKTSALASELEDVPDSTQCQKTSPKSSAGDVSEEEERVSDENHVRGPEVSAWENPVTLQLQADDFLLDTGCEVIPKDQGSLLEEVLSSLKSPLVSGLALENENMIPRNEVAEVKTESVEARLEEKPNKDLSESKVPLSDSLSDSTVDSEEITEETLEKEESVEVPREETKSNVNISVNAKEAAAKTELKEKLFEKTVNVKDHIEGVVEDKLESKTKDDAGKKISDLKAVEPEKRDVGELQDIRRHSGPSEPEKATTANDIENIASTTQTVRADVLNSEPPVEVISSTASHKLESPILHSPLSNTSVYLLEKEEEPGKLRVSGRLQEVNHDVVSEVLESEETASDEVRPRFTITPAWQRSLTTGVVKEQLQMISPGVSETEGIKVSDESPQTNEFLTPAKEERSKPARTHSTPSFPMRKEKHQEESSSGNRFGVRLRKTAVMHRYGLDGESTQKSQAESETLKSPETPDIDQHGKKTVLPMKSDLIVDAVMSSRKLSDPVGSGSVGDAESPSWISVARQKHRNFIENSPETSPEKHNSQEDLKRPDSLSSLPNSVTQEQLAQPCSTIKVFCSMEIANPSMVEKENKRTTIPSTAPLAQDEPPWMALAKKKAKAWSEMPQIVQ